MLGASDARAQADYPSKPIRIVIGTSAGGGSDLMARLIEPSMARAVDAAIRKHGFRYVSVDLRGYRLGSLNEGLTLKQI